MASVKFFMQGPPPPHPTSSPSGTDGDEVGWGGETCKKNPTEAKTAHLNAKLGHFCYFKHEIQLFKVPLSLKVVTFDTKMHLNFLNFRGRTSAGGGTSLGPKTGTSVGWGDWQNFCRMGGTPQSPPGKKPWCERAPEVTIMLKNALKFRGT